MISRLPLPNAVHDDHFSQQALPHKLDMAMKLAVCLISHNARSSGRSIVVSLRAIRFERLTISHYRAILCRCRKLRLYLRERWWTGSELCNIFDGLPYLLISISHLCGRAKILDLDKTLLFPELISTFSNPCTIRARPLHRR